MTVVAASGGVMAADSGQSKGELQGLAFDSKIIRSPDGWLAGCAGDMGEIALFREWFLNGRDPTTRATVKPKDFDALMMGPDGSIWRIGESMVPYRVRDPAVMGEATAEAFVTGAMAYGAPPSTAIELACMECVWVRGPVHVECIDLIQLAAAAE